MEIDGSYGDGGGQLVRTAVALAAIIGAAFTITDIRAERSQPGLAAQRLTAVNAVARLCDAEVGGLALASGEARFTARTLTNHAQTTMWLVEQLLPVRFETASCGEGVAIAVRHASQWP